MVRWEFALVLSSAAGAIAAAAHASSYIQYSTVTGYFLQDDNSTNATTFDYVSKALPYQGLALMHGRLQPISVSSTRHTQVTGRMRRL